jgi:hypothetical protein
MDGLRYLPLNLCLNGVTFYAFNRSGENVSPERLYGG